jgi:methyl-accepting chemotaxis protein
VVADEVRGLAEKSGKAAAEIDAITQGIRSQSQDLEDAIRASAEVLAKSRETLETVSAALQDNAATVAQEHQGIDDINRCLTEQKNAGQEIGRNLESISQAADQTSASSQETANSAGVLKAIAAKLQSGVDRFRV